MKRLRRGAGLIELLIVLALGGIVVAITARTLVRQQRFFATAAQRVGARVQLRDATSLLPSELRALSPPSGDVLAFSDSAVELRATVGVGIACTIAADASGAAIHLAPEETAAATLGAITAHPQPGDVALVFDEGTSDSLGRDTWHALAIAGGARVADACPDSPLRDSSSVASGAPMRLALADGVGVPAGVRAGAFVRLMRRARYRLYRAATGEWYLGYAEWNGVAYGVVQPVSGPYAPYRADRGSSGVALRWFDAHGAELAPTDDPARIARVHVAVRGSGPTPELRGSPERDSLMVTVAPRNR